MPLYDLALALSLSPPSTQPLLHTPPLLRTLGTTPRSLARRPSFFERDAPPPAAAPLLSFSKDQPSLSLCRPRLRSFDPTSSDAFIPGRNFLPIRTWSSSFLHSFGQVRFTPATRSRSLLTHSSLGLAFLVLEQTSIRPYLLFGSIIMGLIHIARAID
jgi:hypothetical protein